MTPDPEKVYLFYKPSLILESSSALDTLISSRLPTALDQHDGTENTSSDVAIDYAQDLIHQARDILLSRGRCFTEDEQACMSFLKWA